MPDHEDVTITLVDGHEVGVLVDEGPSPDPQRAERRKLLKGKALVCLSIELTTGQAFMLDDVIKPFWNELVDEQDYYELCDFIQKEMDFYVITGMYNVRYVPTGPFSDMVAITNPGSFTQSDV